MHIRSDRFIVSIGLGLERDVPKNPFALSEAWVPRNEGPMPSRRAPRESNGLAPHPASGSSPIRTTASGHESDASRRRKCHANEGSQNARAHVTANAASGGTKEGSPDLDMNSRQTSLTSTVK